MKFTFSLKKLRGGYTAWALGYSIFTEADSWEELKAAAQDAVRCHFDAAERPELVRLVTWCAKRYRLHETAGDLTGAELAMLLKQYGYEITCQTGSHMGLTSMVGGEHHVTIPAHSPLRVGTLNAVLRMWLSIWVCHERRC